MKKALLVMRYFKDGRGKNLENKFSCQIDSMNLLGYKCTYFYIMNGYLYIDKFNKTKKLCKIPFYNIPILHNLFEYKKLFGYAAYESINGYDFVYLRSASMTHWFYMAIKKMRQKCSKIVVEIPTYPPEKEAKSDSRIWIKIVSVYSRIITKKSSKYVDLYTLIGDKANTYYNKPAINILNGTDPNRYPIHKKAYDEESIHIIGVASIVNYHGFDRVIEGIRKYINEGGNRKVFFHIVGPDGGDGTLEKLKQTVKKYHLEKFIIFEGPLYGKELDDKFDTCDIACHALACHRKNMDIQFTLKAAEYVSRGIPFFGCPISSDDFEYIPGFYDKISQDDSPVNIQGIINFVESFSNNVNLATEMRDFSKNLTWKAQFEKIFNKLNILN